MQQNGRVFVLVNAIVAIFLLCGNDSQATNLRWGRIVRPVGNIYFGTVNQPLMAYCRNDSSYDAYGVNVYVRVMDIKTAATVFTDTLFVSGIRTRDSVLVGTNKWTPSYPGRFTLMLTVDYVSDVNPTDNIKYYNFAVLPPLIGLFSFAQYSLSAPFNQQFSTFGLFYAKLPPLNSLKYVNVLVRKIKDPNTLVWLVQNFPFFLAKDSVAMACLVDLRKIGITPGLKLDSLEAQVSVSDSGWVEQLIAENEASHPVGHVANTVPLVAEIDTPASVLKDFAPTGGPVWKIPLTSSFLVDRLKDMPNIDLNDSLYPRDPNISWGGDRSACGPAAAANSMQWLLKKHQLPDSTGLRYKLGELSYLMHRDSGGASPMQMIKGKLDFIDKYKLPIHVKFQSMSVNPDVPSVRSGTTKYAKYNHSATNMIDKSKPGNFPTIDFIMSEMQHGEDVALMVGWYDLSRDSNQRLGGHWFTLAGSGYNGNYPFVIENDDEIQGSAGGTSQKMVYLQDPPDNIISGPVIPELTRTVNGKEVICIVESVVSESYDSTITYSTNAVQPETASMMHCTIFKTPDNAVHARVFTDHSTSMSFVISDEIGNVLYRSETLELLSGTNDLLIPEIGVAHGVYFLHLTTDDAVCTSKILR